MSKQIEKNEKKEKQKKKTTKLWKKGWWRQIIKIRTGIIVLLSIIFFFISFFWVPGDIYYRIKEIYTFSASEDASLNLSVLLPSSGPNQEVFDPQVNWPGTWQINDDGRLRVLTLEGSIKAGETLKAVILYRANLSQGTAQWIDQPVTAADTDASTAVQSDAPEIAAQAELLRVAGDEALTLRQIYEFTRDYLDAPPIDTGIGDESALSVFRSGLGGALGRANLLAALSRANGLPAKAISGQKLPYTIPLIPVTATAAYPGQNGIWNEVFYNNAWGLVDPNAPGGFYRPAALGWSDGRHLVYGDIEEETGVFQTLLDNIGEESHWTASSEELLRYVAWADADQSQLELTTKVSLMTTWDARWVMLVALIAITLMMAWLMEEKPQRKRVSLKER